MKQQMKVLCAAILVLAGVGSRAYGNAVEDCDRLAASPFDPNRRGPGIEFKKIDASKAIAACLEALTLEPDNIRLQFQYARSLDKAKRYTQALAWYRRAAEQRYAAAQYGLGWMYANGRGVPKDEAEAVKWYPIWP